MIQGVGAGSPGLRPPAEFPRAGAAAERPASIGTGGASPSGAGEGGFGADLKRFLGEVNDLQTQSNDLFQGFVRGEVQDLHQVLLAQQEAGIAVRLVGEMRDRLLQSYQEVMRMTM